MTTLSCQSLCLSYDKNTVLDDVSLDIAEGEITTIVGPNACGKSSLLRCLGRLQKPTRGSVNLGDTAIHKMKTREVAQRLAFLPQNTTAPAGMRVIDLVLRGRTPHQSPMRQWSRDDEQHVQKALEQVNLEGRATQLLQNLSGGQLQRAWIAMVLAQNPQILILDEPTTYLDLPHQRDILQLVRDLQKENGLTVIMVLHDINFAARYSDQIVALKDKRVFCSGTPTEVVTQENMADIYGLDCTIIADPHTGQPHMIMK
ncbi:ABC transporter ATP-binding protein [Loktanella sp. S4079]|uniref:ABC transporter ATP-binding protein n=1 Tax=Loktanella sp. S4079 TaxID=579483 RepID=UPI0005F9E921|nr:ABC transporter ATP-binding protein [Loktanella sp. S4079]KJZ18504.1 hypothetical protein TW80_13805 [Loktanella sp. S4079]